MQKYKKIIINFFKKLSLIDYMLILLVILALAFAIFYFDREKKVIYIDLLVREKEWGGVNPLEKWQTLQIAEGDEIYNFAGEKTAEIIFVDRIPFGGNQKHDVYLTLEIEALYDKRRKNYSYLGKPLVVGKSFDFTTRKYFFEGMIVDVYENREEWMDKYVEKTALVKVKLGGIENTVVDQFRKLFTDGYSNQDIIEVKNLLVEPNKSQTVDYLGRKVVAFEQLSSDLYFDFVVKIWCFEDNFDICFYSYRRPLLISEGFYNDADRIFIAGKILDYTLLD